MLSRFKNALYGSSNSSADDTSPDYDYREAVIGKRIRNALTRSSSFREDLLSESGRQQRNNNNNSLGAFRGKSQIFGANVNETYDDSKIDHNGKQQNSPKRVHKFCYSRPEFLQLKTEDEISVSADHQIRPIILPRDINRLPWKSGYAECINAGKSKRNEDQASCYQDVLVKSLTAHQFINDSNSINPEDKLPWSYFGIFDGHAGTAVAVAAASQLHKIVANKLNHLADILIKLEFELVPDEDYDDTFVDCTEDTGASKSNDDSNDGTKLPKVDETTNDKGDGSSPSTKEKDSPEVSEPQNEADEKDSTKAGAENKSTPSGQSDKIAQLSSVSKTYLSLSQDSSMQSLLSSFGQTEALPSMIDICRNNITVDSLVIGALESAFWEMDALIAQDKLDYKMPGGCTAIVGLFILGKLYVCNAGDSRGIVYKNNKVIPMSFDFTPTSERERILRLGLQRPEFLGKDFTHLEFVRRPTRRDLGKQMLYRDAYMKGWSMKTIDYDDLRFPLVWGEGKRSRVLATIGVTRGFGDHELRAQYGSVLIKPFLTPEPEVRILPLENDELLSAEDVLIMGSDGLWDVTTNQEAANIVKNSFDLFPDSEESRSKYRYITAAQDLVIHSRGHVTGRSNVWHTSDERLASLDDIAVFVIPLKQYRDEYLEWKKLRSEATKVKCRQQVAELKQNLIKELSDYARQPSI